MIEFKKTCKQFGELEVLKDLDLKIEQGGIFSILGPNGSGKTTLIKCLLGMVIPDSGNIEIDGKNIINEFLYRNDINYLPQIARFPENLTVQELISMVKDLRPKLSDEEHLLKLFNLDPFLDKKLGNLSGGTRQKVNIILTFMFDSSLIILDEPTSGLDPVSLIQLKEILFQEKEKNKTILLTTHIMGLAEDISDEIVFLLEGKIYFKGNLSALMKQTGQSNLESSIAHLLRNQC